ncbi:TRAP transporter large permease subunit [Bacillus sp. ISL-47]|uniref:TRAP transporter large permease n=1 Tax=Bacillus sp. ISL-47 TaxID=2819130 RepID=UPI001BE72C9F|nr:TRAP transporter large permease subunit [Bacillus sp. ISL-47]MBT2690640.1 TRAP transporter large permease subunit [Bacillus sp. ISL-47]MBT2710827.1 TRAP transporter large permease subunit [Pseudomonas sp. ISL-84]
MIEAIIIFSMFIGLIIGLATGHPLAFVLGGLGVIAGVFGWGPQVFDIFSNSIFGTMSNYTLVAIPLFTLMANFLSSSRVADGLFEYMRYLLGPLRGGVALTVIVVSTIFAATTGIVGASIVTMGVLGMPVLLKYGYDKRLASGVVAAGGTLGILIPPSIMLIVLGAQAQVSVGKLFLSSIVPGLMLAGAYCVYVLIACWKNPDWGPAVSKEEMKDMPMRKVIIGSLVNLVPPMILIFAVLGTIFTGVATPTESAGVGAFLSLMMAIAYKRFTWKMLADAVYDTAKITAMALVIIVGATAFTSIFLALDGDTLIQNFVVDLGLSKWGVFIAMMLISFILGMFIDWIGIVMIIMPIFLPLLELYNFDLIWVVTVFAVLLQTSFLTPPFGFALFYLKGIVPPEVKMTDIYKGIIPFVIIMLIVTTLITVFPDIVMWLPNMSKL